MRDIRAAQGNIPTSSRSRSVKNAAGAKLDKTSLSAGVLQGIPFGIPLGGAMFLVQPLGERTTDCAPGAALPDCVSGVDFGRGEVPGKST